MTTEAARRSPASYERQIRRRIAPLRVLILTLALSVVGAVVGALLGTLVLVLLGLPDIVRGPGHLLLASLLFGGVVGVPLGAVGRRWSAGSSCAACRSGGPSC